MGARKTTAVDDQAWYEELKAMNEDLKKEDITLVQEGGLIGAVVRSAPAGAHLHEGEGVEPLLHAHAGGLAPHPHYEGQELVYPAAGYSIPSGMGVEGGVIRGLEAEAEGEVGVYDHDEAAWDRMAAWIIEHQAEVRKLALERAREYGEQDFHFMAAVSAVMEGTRVTAEDELEQLVRLQKEMVRYISGKLGRAATALAKGQVPSLDNWRDIEVYAFIAAKFQETGTWVG